MSEPSQNGFWRRVESGILTPLQQGFSKASNTIRQTAQTTLTEAERTAATAAIQAEKAWKDYDVDQRLLTAAGGAKLGGVFGLRAGPKGAVVGLVVGAAAGFIGGPTVIERFREWRNSHKPKQITHYTQEPPSSKGPQ